jgi:D-beta-D-heptose 7-phosphate kinase/D-beta-D-heptose 1-phosphate adenosyltransferase
MLDEFVWGKVRRISPEAPVPVVEVIEETYRLGGAANVAANIQALGATPIPIGVVGNDGAGIRIHELMMTAGVSTSGLIQDGRPTTLKSRILAHNQQIARTDRESRVPLLAEANKKLESAFVSSLDHAQGIIVSDYDKGVVNRELLKAVLPRARAAGVPVFLDPKVHHADYYHPVTMITPNHSEAELLTGMAIQTSEMLEIAGRKLLDKFRCEYVLITRGEEGMSLFKHTGSHHLPTFAREVFDVTGAGDTVIATLSVMFAGGGSMEESAILANHAAGIVVGKIGTAVVYRSELLSDFDSRNAHSAG